MSKTNIFRFGVLFALWLLVVIYLLTHTQITLYIVFVCVASWIIIFVPMYKKYVKKKD